MSGKNRPKRVKSWMAELLFEQSLTPTRLESSEQVAHDSEWQDAKLTRSALVDGTLGNSPPRTFAQYRALLSELFDTKRDKVLQVLKKQAVFPAALTAWLPKQSTSNAHIARELTPYVAKAMEQIYDYGAPPVDFVPSAGFLGTYDMRSHRIALSSRLFASPLKEFLDTLVHEEIHAMQTDLMLMLNTQRKGRVLSGPERAIAHYWKNEEPKYRSALAAGSQMSPDTKRRYRMIGQEYHAWTTGHYVASKLVGIYT